MATGFLTAEALAPALRKPYENGNTAVTLDYLIEGLKLGPFRVLLKRDFNTACWIPPAGSRGSHSIYYGDRMLKRVFDRFCRIEGIEVSQEDLLAGLEQLLDPASPQTRSWESHQFDAELRAAKKVATPDQWNRFEKLLARAVASYGRHERQHARCTPQDLKAVRKDLAERGIPFMYFNLFEDARIEHISRQELGRKFDWRDFEDLEPIETPASLFLRCIQLEGEPDTEALEGTATGSPAALVEGFYRQAIGCTKAEDLYPIIVEFLRTFKEESTQSGSAGSGKDEDGSRGESSGGSSDPQDSSSEGASSEGTSAKGRAGDLSDAAEASERGDAFFDEFDDDAVVVGGTDEEGIAAEAAAKGQTRPRGASAKEANAKGIEESVTPYATGSNGREEYFLLKSAVSKLNDADEKRLAGLVNRLMRMFKTHTLPIAKESPGRRMSARHLARNEFRWLHPQILGGKGKRKYTIVYDCSGSMYGFPHREGRLLLLAFNELAKRGYLEGSLILSGFWNRKPSWLQYQFPVADDVILRIHPRHDAEGLQASLHDNLKHIQGTDDVFVYTDACICDAPINRDMFSQNRVWPVGLYVGKEEDATSMDKHFPQNIIRQSIEELVEAMLIRNRRTVG